MRYLIIGILLLLVPLTVQGQVQPGHGNNVQDCDSFTVTAVNQVVSAGTFHACIHYPDVVATSDSSFWLSVHIAGPPLLGLTPSVTVVMPSIAGCSWSGFFSGPFGPIAAANAFGTQRAWTAEINMDSVQCHLYVIVRVFATTTLFEAALPVNVHALDASTNQRNYLCDSSTTTANPIPNSECTSPTLNSVISGDLDVHQDQACGTTTPCEIDLSGSFSSNVTNNSSTDFGSIFVDWFPLWMAIVMIAIATRHSGSIEPNCLLIGSVLFVIAGLLCPFPNWDEPEGLALRIAVIGIGLWALMKYGDYREPKNLEEE